MKHLNFRRVAAVGATTALAAGTLVGATATTAQAAEVTTVYTCTPPIGNAFDVSVLSSLGGLDSLPEIHAGFDVPVGFVPVSNTFTVSDAVHTALIDSFHITNVAFPDYAGEFGAKKVEVTGMSADTSTFVDSGDDMWSIDANGANAAFEVPKAGTYNVKSPASFTMNATNADGGTLPVPCVLKTGTSQGTYATLDVTKNASTTKATLVKNPVPKGTKGKLDVVVKADNQKPTGKVVAKKGDKTIGSATLNNKGKATVTLDKLKPGKYKVTVSYKGDGYTSKSKTTVTVKVAK